MKVAEGIVRIIMENLLEPFGGGEGRFFQEDTYLGDIADPLTLNRYAYTKNSPLNYVDPSGHKISSLGDFVSFVQNKATEFRDKASSYIYEKATGALKGMSEWAKESCETLDCELVTVAYNILLGAGFALVENALNIIFSMKELGSQWDSSDSDYYQKLMEDWVLENGVTDTTYFYLGQLVSDALQTYFAVKAIPKLLTKIGPALTKLAGILGGGSGGGMVPALVGVGEYASQIGMSAEIAETLVNEFGAAVAGVLIVFADITGIGHDAGKFVEALTKGDSKSKLKWGNPKSTPTYGHTFSEHGQKQTAQQLIDRANGFENPHQVGQWLDNQQAADFLADAAKKGEGAFDVKLPSDIKARVFLPDGTEVTPDMAKIVLKPDGSIRTAYPYSSLYPTN